MNCFARNVLALLLVSMLLSQTKALSFKKISQSIVNAAQEVGDAVNNVVEQAKITVDKGVETASSLTELAKDKIEKTFKKTTDKGNKSRNNNTKQTEFVLLESIKTQSKNLREVFMHARDLAKDATAQVGKVGDTKESFWRKAAKFFTDIESTKEVVKQVCIFGKEKFIQMRNVIVKVIKFFFKGLKKVCVILKKTIKVTFAFAYKYVFKDLLIHASKLALDVLDKLNLKFLINLYYNIISILCGFKNLVSAILSILNAYPNASSALIGAFIVTKVFKRISNIFS